VFPIELRQESQLHLLLFGLLEAAVNVGYRFGAGDDPDALVAAGQEVRSPDLRPGVGEIRRQNDERREVLIHRAEAVADPGTEARPREREGAGVDLEGGLEVIAMIAAHRIDQAKVVGHLGDVRKEVADVEAGLTARPEFPVRFVEVTLIDLLVLRLEQGGLVIERIDVRRPAGHEEENDAPGLAGEMRLPGRQRIEAGIFGSEQFGEDRGQDQRAAQQRADRLASRATAGATVFHNSIQSTKTNSLLAKITRARLDQVRSGSCSSGMPSALSFPR
jgi:hypothetical protein